LRSFAEFDAGLIRLRSREDMKVAKAKGQLIRPAGVIDRAAGGPNG